MIPCSRLCFRLPLAALLALAALAVPSARAADDPGVVALPPFMVEEATKGPPWRYAQSPDFEILSRCSDRMTVEVTETYHRLHRLLTLVLPEHLQVRQAVPKTAIYYDEEMQPAASREIISQMVRSANGALPGPASDDAAGWDGAGFRRSASVQRKVVFHPTMRLWDKDAMAAFLIVRPGAFDGSTLFLTPDYVGYLMRNRTPTLPTWFVSGLTSLYPKIKFNRASLTYDAAVWVSESETLVLKQDPAKARPLLPALAFFRGETAANQQTPAENFKVWASQAELFLRWGLNERGTPRHGGFWKFVERSALEAPSEQLLHECFGFDAATLNEQLTAFLPMAVRKEATLRYDTPITLPPLALRNATDGEIARIKGDWERLEIDYVRRRYPDLAGKYIEQARRTLLRAYDRGDRDPRLVALLGLCEIDSGNDAGAREYLESAARLGVVRPRAWYELARLRYAERLAAPVMDGKLSAAQAAEVLTPLFTARRQAPPLAEVYELIAEVWLNCSHAPKPAHLAVVGEGLMLFPRRVPLLLRAAQLYLEHGTPAEAAVLVRVGLHLADNDEDRARFAALQGRLPVTPP